MEIALIVGSLSMLVGCSHSASVGEESSPPLEDVDKPTISTVGIPYDVFLSGPHAKWPSLDELRAGGSPDEQELDGMPRGSTPEP